MNPVRPAGASSRKLTSAELAVLFCQSMTNGFISGCWAKAASGIKAPAMTTVKHFMGIFTFVRAEPAESRFQAELPAPPWISIFETPGPVYTRHTVGQHAVGGCVFPYKMRYYKGEGNLCGTLVVSLS